MVPNRMLKHDERYTGKWWLELENRRGWFGPAFRLHVMLEIEEGWANDVPPMPGTEKQLDWRLTDRRATQSEILMFLTYRRPEFKFSPRRFRKSIAP